MPTVERKLVDAPLDLQKSERDKKIIVGAVTGPSTTHDNATGPGATGSKSAPGLRLCANCRHYRLRSTPQLFSATELQTAGGLKAYSEWQQQEKQHAEREAQLVASGGPFTYEPHHYAWCAAFTRLDLVEKASAGDESALAELMASGGATINPVTGKITPVYALCLRRNSRGDCEKYEPR